MRNAVLFTLLLAACRERATAPKPSPAQPASPPAATATAPPDLANEKIVEPIQLAASGVSRSAIGAAGSDGNVSTQKTEFAAGEPVSLTMWLDKSPAGLRMRAEWRRGEKVMHEESRDVNGAKVVTFALKEKLAPGTYQVVGYWGGNIGAEHEFTVE